MVEHRERNWVGLLYVHDHVLDDHALDLPMNTLLECGREAICDHGFRGFGYSSKL